MSRQYRKELGLFISNREGKEFSGSFLWHVFYHYECDTERVKQELRQQYKEKGTIEMGKQWGFDYHTIQEGLKKLGIRIKPRIYNNAPHGLASEAFEKYGGIEKVLKQFGSVTKFSKICKLSVSSLLQYLNKQGYYYDREERKWKVKGGK